MARHSCPGSGTAPAEGHSLSSALPSRVANPATASTRFPGKHSVAQPGTDSRTQKCQQVTLSSHLPQITKAWVTKASKFKCKRVKTRSAQVGIPPPCPLGAHILSSASLSSKVCTRVRWEGASWGMSQYQKRALAVRHACAWMGVSSWCQQHHQAKSETWL